MRHNAIAGSSAALTDNIAASEAWERRAVITDRTGAAASIAILAAYVAFLALDLKSVWKFYPNYRFFPLIFIAAYPISASDGHGVRIHI